MSAVDGRRSRRRLLTGLVAVVVAAVVVVVVIRQRREEPVALPSCHGFEQLTSNKAARPEEIQGWSYRQGALDPGDSYVDLVDTPANTTWRYRQATVVPGTTRVIEGKYRPGSVDQRDTLWEAGRSPELGLVRTVVIGDEAWSDRTATLGWHHCRTYGGNAFAQKDMVFSYRKSGSPNESTSCSGETCALFAVPGARVRVRNGVESVVNGETLTTYEVVGFARGAPEYENLRATMTVDQGRRLRGGKVWDAKTGAVYYTLDAGPAPANPPIVDPSNQPLLSQQPPPTPPPTETVPVP